MKVHIANKVPLDQKILAAHFELTDQLAEAAFVICGKTVPDAVTPSRCILLQSEPPLTAHRRHLYAAAGEFHTVITFVPRQENQFRFTDNPVVFPYSPALQLDRVRGDTTLSARGLFYAGRRRAAFERVPDGFGSINLYPVRAQICDTLQKEWPSLSILGEGFGRDTKTGIVGWRVQKQKDIEDSGADFVLCLENSRMENYVSEKLHDGMSSDRVALYLGAPNITEHVPREAFVDLSRFFDEGQKRFDTRGLMDLLAGMDQAAYDGMLRAARGFRKTLSGQYEAERERLTKFVVKRIMGSQ